MHQQQTPSLSDRAMDELYVAQYLAMANMDATNRDVTRIAIGRPAAPPDDMVVSVDWDRRETSITYTYAYRDGRNIIQSPPHATSAPAPFPQNPVPSTTNAGTAGAASAEVPLASSGAEASTQDAGRSSMADVPMQGVAASRESDSKPSGSVPEQPSEQGIQAEAATAGGVQHTAPAPRPDETSAASGSQASLNQVNMDAGTIKAEKPKSQNKKRLAIRRHANKIARTDDYTEWYSSCSRDPLAEPPNVRRSPGILYVHRHKHETEAKWDTQVWMYARRERAQPGAVRKGIFLLQNRDAGTEGEWVAVRPGQKHPELPGYVLHLRETGEPSWVKASTARTYRARGQADS